MESADNSKLKLDNFEDVGGLEEKIGSQKISVIDHIKGLQKTTEKSDSFVIDIEDFSHGIPKDTISSPRIERSLSRKGIQVRGSVNEKRVISNTSPSEREPAVAISSPRGPSTPGKGKMPTVGTTDRSQVHHQITITTSNFNSSTEERCTTRRNSCKRYPSTWVLDPKRVLFLFATLSSMGTMLLIYFTLSMGKISVTENA